MTSGALERLIPELNDEFAPGEESSDVFSGPPHMWYDNMFPMDAAKNKNIISKPAAAAQDNISAAAAKDNISAPAVAPDTMTTPAAGMETNVTSAVPQLEIFPPETLEKKKRRLIAYEESFIKDDVKLSLFEQWFNDKKYDIDNDLYRAWLIFKRSATGSPKEALNYVLESKVPKNVTKSKTKRKTQQPDGAKRHDPLSDEWMEIFRSRSEKEAAKDVKQATRRSGRKRGGK